MLPQKNGSNRFDCEFTQPLNSQNYFKKRQKIITVQQPKIDFKSVSISFQMTEKFTLRAFQTCNGYQVREHKGLFLQPSHLFFLSEFFQKYFESVFISFQMTGKFPSRVFRICNGQVRVHKEPFLQASSIMNLWQ